MQSQYSDPGAGSQAVEQKKSPVGARKERLKKIVRTLSAGLLKIEPEFLETKLRRYRHLDPMQLNREFAKAYSEAFKWEFRSTVDYKQAENVRGIDLSLFGILGKERDDAGVRKAVHRARQYADLHGMAYNDFIGFCFRFARASGAGRKRLIQPNQLIPWKFIGAFSRELEKFIAETDATSIAREKREHPGPFPAAPGCIGVIGAHHPATGTCRTCPFQQQCGAICAKIGAQMKSKGMLSLAEQKSADNAARQKRFRDKKKAPAAGSATPVLF